MTMTTTESQITAITIGRNARLRLADAKFLAHKGYAVQISKESYVAMEHSYTFLKSCVDNRLPIYGINTNFGDQVSLLDKHINNDDVTLYEVSIKARQQNIIKSLACGLGTVVPSEYVRTTMMLRAHCLAQGYSGVSKRSIDAILDFINAGITPIVRCYGSIGASGDLIPLSMIASALIGENVDVLYRGEIMRAPQAMAIAGLKKFEPEMRDGLAMINGTSFMTGITCLALYDLHRLFKQTLSAIAMTLESMLVISSAYHPLVHDLKGQYGEKIVNQFLLDFWKDSKLLTNLDELRTTGTKPVQDYYSLRAVAQGFGPLQENLERAVTWIENEMNSINDNPIIDANDKQIHHSANFMGYYVTDTCDMLKMNISQASTWLHALLANLVHPRKSQQLPANLAEDPANQNGFRSLQLLAAALAVQNRKLAQSHQAFMLPTEGDNQDVNSLGTHAALDLQESVANLERLTAILLLAGTQALELRGIERASPRAQNIANVVRQYSPKLVECHPMTEELNIVIEMLREEKI